MVRSGKVRHSMFSNVPRSLIATDGQGGIGGQRQQRIKRYGLVRTIQLVIECGYRLDV